MALLNYISIEISEVLADCGYMNDRVFGKYMRFLFYWYRDGCKPLTESALIRLSNSRGSDLDAIKARLIETPDGWVQRRLFDTYQEVLKKSDKARASANARWEQEKRNSNAMRPHKKRKSESDAGAMLNANSKLLKDSVVLTNDSPNSENSGLSMPDPVEVAFKQFQTFAEKHGLPKPTKLTKGRRAKLKARFREHGPGIWSTVFAEIEASPGLKGANAKGWQVDFDFLLQPSSLQKLIEGKYRNWGKANNHEQQKSDDEFRQAAARGTLGARYRD